MGFISLSFIDFIIAVMMLLGTLFFIVMFLGQFYQYLKDRFKRP